MTVIKRVLLVATLVATSLLPPLGSAAVWGPEARLTNAYGYSLAPQVAAYNGTIHVVWFDFVGAQADAEVLYARSTDNGATWSSPVNLSASPTRIDVHPAIAADASGVYVLWGSDVMSGELYFRRSHDNGTSWRPVQQLTNGPGYSRAGGLAIDATGTLHAVYYDDRVGWSNIYHVQSCDHGATWTADQNVTTYTGVVDNESPHLSVGWDGKLYLAYRSSLGGSYGGGWPPYQIYLLRGTSAACPGNPSWFYPAQRVTRGLPEEHADAHSPDVVAGASGFTHVAFWDRLAGTEVAYRRLDPLRGFGPIQRLGGFGPNHPTPGATNSEAGNLGMAEDNAAGVHLLFSENTGTDGVITYGRVLYRGSLDAGTTFGALEQVGTTVTAGMPRFTYGRGRVHAAWVDFRDNNVGSEIYYRYRDLQQIDLVDHYYRKVLNRAPDPQGFAAWQGELSRVQWYGLDAREMFMMMAGYFFNTAEYAFRYRDNTQYTTDLYWTFFNRAPDAPSQAFWVAQLDAGAPRDMVRHAFALSGEADAFYRSALDRTDGRASDTIVSDMYRSILNRMPDQLYPAWRQGFRAAQCGGTAAVLAQATSMADGFFNSVEYWLRGRDNWGYMQDLYLAVMRRYAPLSELVAWTYNLNIGAYTRSQVRSIFLNSLEFQLRANRIVAEGCLQ